jgi:hypothetical protein
MLKKGLRQGFGTLSKGLFRKYEHQLREEEADADLLRKQNLALYEDKLLTDRTIKIAEKQQEITLDTQKKSALQKGEVAEEITMRDAGNLYESLAKREGIENLPGKEEFIDDMLFISRASAGATPLDNDQKIELLKEANKSWNDMATLGGDEYEALIAEHGPDKAREKYIHKTINNSIFGGTSMLAKTEAIVGKSKKAKTIKEIQEGDPDEMVEKIMKTQDVTRPEAEELYEEITGRPAIRSDKVKRKPSFLRQSFPGLFTDEKEEKESKSIFDM